MSRATRYSRIASVHNIAGVGRCTLSGAVFNLSPSGLDPLRTCLFEPLRWTLMSRRASSSPPCVGEINRRSCEPRREVALNHVAIGRKGKGRQLAFEGEPSQFIDVITGACDTSDRLGK